MIHILLPFVTFIIPHIILAILKLVCNTEHSVSQVLLEKCGS